jgi:hypothetical protein
LLGAAASFLRERYSSTLRWHYPFRRNEPRSRGSFYRRLRQSLRDNAPAIALLELGGRGAHWTLTWKLSVRLLHLFDSGPDMRKQLRMSDHSISGFARGVPSCWRSGVRSRCRRASVTRGKIARWDNFPVGKCAIRKIGANLKMRAQVCCA